MKRFLIVALFLLLASPLFATATTDTLVSGYLGVYSSVTTGTAAISAVLTPAMCAEIMEVRLHLSVAATSGTLVSKIDEVGDDYDFVINSGTITSASYVWQPTRPVFLKPTDLLDISWENAAGRVWGIEIIWRIAK